MNSDGPYIAVASLCDLVLHEKDERISCIRFLDTLNLAISEDAPDPLPPVVVQANGLLSFKSGKFVGSKTLQIVLRNPLGKQGKPIQTFPLTFKGHEQGANVILRMQIQIEQEGLYYFDISLDEEIVTRIPLRVFITRTKQPEQTNSQNV
jgi:hypothetical protein